MRCIASSSRERIQLVVCACATMAGIKIAGQPMHATIQSTIIRDWMNNVACLVAPTAPSQNGHEGLKVQVRAPSVSLQEVVGRIPGGIEAFTGLPVRVSLLDKAGEVPVQRPAIAERALKRPVVDGTTLPDEFVSVVFPKAWLVVSHHRG